MLTNITNMILISDQLIKLSECEFWVENWYFLVTNEWYNEILWFIIMLLLTGWSAHHKITSFTQYIRLSNYNLLPSLEYWSSLAILIFFFYVIPIFMLKLLFLNILSQKFHIDILNYLWNVVHCIIWICTIIYKF